MQNDEKLRVEIATADFNRVGALTDRISLIIFLVPAIVSAIVAFRVSRHLAGGLEKLKQGAELIGQLQLGFRIDLQSKDELGDLARSYNQMADKLEVARTQLRRASDEMVERNKELEQERSTADKLLLNILPIQVAKELKEKGSVEPKYFEDVTIIFTDFVGFTLSTEKLAAEDLVRALDDYFTIFDQIVERYYVEKMKTIGDSYMYVAGLPLDRRARRAPSHPVDAVMAAFEMVEAVKQRALSENSVRWSVRVGVHTGAVIAGVVGIQKFAFDVWGDSVNTASRMESSGVANHINMSYATYVRVKDFFDCEHRGKIPTKDKREIDMYLAKGLLPSLVGDGTLIPPEAFLRRYRVYFQKEPPSFPAFLLQPPAQRIAASPSVVIPE
jgi:class 3 adenylate cyclase